MSGRNPYSEELHWWLSGVGRVVRSRRTIIAGSLLLALVAAIVGADYALRPRERTVPIEVRPNGDVSGFPLERRIKARVTLESLIDEFKENELAAEAKYADPPEALCHYADGCALVDTSGIVEELGRDQNGEAYLQIRAPASQLGSISAEFSRANEAGLRSVRRGQRVQLQCEVRYHSGFLTLKKCGLAGN